MENVIEHSDGLLALDTDKNWRAVCKNGNRWVGGVYDHKNGQFCDGIHLARGMYANSLRQAYTQIFATKRAALVWLTEDA